jgi:hypothetical protein
MVPRPPGATSVGPALIIARLARQDESRGEKARERGQRGDRRSEHGEHRLAHNHQQERGGTPHRAPDPVKMVVKVLTHTARSIASDRWRRYQRSYESLSAVPSASAV